MPTLNVWACAIKALLHLTQFPTPSPPSSFPFLSAVASQSEAMGAGLEQCIVGYPASVTIVTRDKSGGACKSGNAILSAEVCCTVTLKYNVHSSMGTFTKMDPCVNPGIHP